MKYSFSLFLCLYLIQGLQAQDVQRTGGVVRGSAADNHRTSQMTCDTIFSFFTNDNWPAGLAFDGSTFYVSGYDSAFIYKYNTAGQNTGKIPSPCQTTTLKGGDMDFDGTNLWVVVEDQGILYKLNPSNGTVLNQFSLPGGTLEYYGCAWDNGYIWVSEYNTRKLIRLDANTGLAVNTFNYNREVFGLKIINGNLFGIEWVNGSMNNARLDKFDKNTGAVLDSVAWCLPYPLSLNYAVSHLWGTSSLPSSGLRRVLEFDTTFTTLGITQAPVLMATLAPNPCTFETWINFNEDQTATTVYITDLLGHLQKKIDFSGRRLRIGKDELAAGAYFVKLVNGNRSSILKLLIN